MSKTVVCGEAKFTRDGNLPEKNVRVLVTMRPKDGNGEDIVEPTWLMDNGEWEITAAGNERVTEYEVVAWVEWPAPFGPK